MRQPTAHVPAPALTIDADGVVRSAAFDDIYYSTRGGAAETEHVFLRGNGLPDRWQRSAAFTIGELGFGTGLNFLTALRHYLATTTDGHLHYVAVEQFPPAREQLQTLFGDDPLAAELIAQWPLRLPGLHRLQFERATLTLGYGDAAALLSDIDATIDAWFLDGFAPAKNPAMWSDAVFQQLTRLSAAEATLATFTVAGAVRRGLQDAGFTVSKAPGFAHKRDMLRGVRRGEPSEAIRPDHAETALLRFACKDAIIVGAGIAGCSIAHALATRGWRVRVFDGRGVASGASGNAAAVLYPQLTKYYMPATEWHFAAYDFMLRQLPHWRAQGLGFTYEQPGMLKIPKDAADEQRLRAINQSLGLDAAIARWVEREEGAALIGQSVTHGGFWFPRGTWLAPAELCAALLRHPNIHYEHEHVLAVQPNGVTTAHGMRAADAVIVANAQQAQRWFPALTLGVSAGQVTATQPAAIDAILCHKGYAIAHPQGLLIGATYDRDDIREAVTDANHAQNLTELAQAAPGLAGLHAMHGRTSLRATTPQRLPYVGCSDGVWLSVGHGSRGMLSAPLAAEVIASALNGEPCPVTRSLRAVLQPPASPSMQNPRG